MLPITINPELCRADELCVHECPMSVLTVEEKGKAPIVHPKKTKHCIDCGHCAAICPTNAISMNAFSEQNSTPFSPEQLPSFESVQTLIKSRRSVRKFKKKPLNVKDIEELIHLTAYTPSGHNAKNESWTVLDTPEKVQELTEVIVEWMRDMVKQKDPLAKKLFLAGMVNAYKKGRDVICRNAPALAVAWAPQQGITPQADTVLATGYMEMLAHAKGLGACWAGYLVMAAAHSEKVRRFLGVPDDHMIYGALLLGHPAVKYKNLPPQYKAIGEELNGMTIFKARNVDH